MKKMMLVAAACAMVAAPSVLFAQDEPVTSVNVVGYYSVTIERGSELMLSAPLIPIDGSTIPDIIGDQLPVRSRVFVWDRSAEPPRYRTLTYDPVDPRNPDGDPVWGGATDVVVSSGDGFFVRIPSDAVQPAYSVTLMGEVPGAGNEYGTVTLSGLSGYNMVALAFPVDIVFTETELASNADVLQILLWNEDPADQRYIPFSRQADRGVPFAGDWPENPPTIPAGRAFWVRTGAPIDWTETAPYLGNL